MRLAWLQPLCGLLTACAVMILFLVPACGRSSLEPESLDSGIVTPPRTCTTATCPNGCCDATGVCRVGTDSRACGDFAVTCSDCIAQGFDSCGSAKTCSRAGCAGCNGCCDKTSGVEICRAGTQANFCGRSDVACTDCTVQGRTCDPSTGACGTSTCDASNCAGCCVGDKCLLGTDVTACGVAGTQCQDCLDNGQTCTPKGAGGTCTGTPTCGPSNCAGCCNGTTCVTGSDGTACGKSGAACQDCTKTGQVCDGGSKSCVTQQTCNAATCAGCCVGNNCVIATTQAECGKGGVACSPCAANETCNAGVCQPADTCGPLSCGGCCVGDLCTAGNQATACGTAGASCENCAGEGKVCQGGSCQTPTCGPANCIGCCSGNTCVTGTQDAACGATTGQACKDCTTGNQVCIGRACVDKCGPGNCPTGCCTTGNVCAALGTANNACGSGGVACVNCTAGGSTCDSLVTPHVCTNMQNKCPASYTTCAAGVTTPILPTSQGVCTALEIQSLTDACSDTPNDPVCSGTFSVLQASDAACATCIAPFFVDFSNRQGQYECIAPAASTSCDHSTGCVLDCESTSCVQCAPGSTAQCKTEVDGGQCGTFLTQVNACAGGLLAKGQLCATTTYANYGGWLEAVATHFCD